MQSARNVHEGQKATTSSEGSEDAPLEKGMTGWIGRVGQSTLQQRGEGGVLKQALWLLWRGSGSPRERFGDLLLVWSATGCELSGRRGGSIAGGSPTKPTLALLDWAS